MLRLVFGLVLSLTNRGRRSPKISSYIFSLSSSGKLKRGKCGPIVLLESQIVASKTLLSSADMSNYDLVSILRRLQRCCNTLVVTGLVDYLSI